MTTWLATVVTTVAPLLSPSPEVGLPPPPPDNPWAAGFWTALGFAAALVVVFVVAYRLGMTGWPHRRWRGAFDDMQKKKLPDEPHPGGYGATGWPFNRPR